MPLYVADYLRDTRKLTAAEHGAYLLLIMEYWTVGELPADDRQLSRIASMSPAEWKRARPNIEGFFHDGWKHKRLDAELAKSIEISSKRSTSAKQRNSKCSANAQQMDTHAGATSQPQSLDRIGSAGASNFTEGSKALSDSLWKALGLNAPLGIPPELAGADWRAIEWEKTGWTVDLIDSQARKIGPGKPLIYYEKCFATEFAKRQAPLPIVEIKQAEKLTVKNHGTSSNPNSLIGAIDRQIAALESADGPDPALSESPVLLLSSGSIR